VIGVITEVLDSGVSIPGKLSILNFDNMDQSSCVRPSLPLGAVDYQTISGAACMLMFDMTENGSCELNANIYVSLNLAEREYAKG
jgi:DNA-binding LacI/PurR family transcriptional regulator